MPLISCHCSQVDLVVAYIQVLPQLSDLGLRLIFEDSVERIAAVAVVRTMRLSCTGQKTDLTFSEIPTSALMKERALFESPSFALELCGTSAESHAFLDLKTIPCNSGDQMARSGQDLLLGSSISV